MFSTILTKTNIELFRCYNKIFDIKELLNTGNILMLINIVSTMILSYLFLFQNLKTILSKLNTKLRFNPPLSENENTNSSSTDDNESPKGTKRNGLTDKYLTDSFPKSVPKLSLFSPLTSTQSIKKIVLPLPPTSPSDEYSSIELNEMEYEDAIINDTRSYFVYYKVILTEKQIILSTVLSNSIFYPLSIRLIMLIFSIASFSFLMHYFSLKNI